MVTTRVVVETTDGIRVAELLDGPHLSWVEHGEYHAEDLLDLLDREAMKVGLQTLPGIAMKNAARSMSRHFRAYYQPVNVRRVRATEGALPRKLGPTCAAPNRIT